jgi:hypothetical protein
VGNSGWSYTVAANASVWQRYPELISSVTGAGGSSGGIGLPGHTDPVPTTSTRYSRLLAQTLDFSLASPLRRLWKGASLTTTLHATAFNQSLGRRGMAPGLNVGFEQSLRKYGSVQLNYSYDQSGGVFADADLTNVVSASVFLTPMHRLSASASVTKSLSDHSFYGSTGLDYAIASKWRIGLFGDYSTFDNTVDKYFDYGWTLGRTVGQRELTLNWSHLRNRIYFEIGGFRL